MECVRVPPEHAYLGAGAHRAEAQWSRSVLLCDTAGVGGGHNPAPCLRPGGAPLPQVAGPLALVHWWYLPDSYDEWVPAGTAPAEVEHEKRPKGPWKVGQGGQGPRRAWRAVPFCAESPLRRAGLGCWLWEAPLLHLR